jgi:hypothetical protein
MTLGNAEQPRRSARDLYVDLLIRTLANTIYRDHSADPWNGNKAFDEGIRAQGRDWPSVAHTMVGLRRLENLRDLVQHALDENIPGDLIETGVWRGGCCILMRGILAANGDRTRKVYVADSFEGLPPPMRPEDTGDRHHTFTELVVSESEVRANFEKYGLLDDQVVFVKGFYADTLHNLNADALAVLRLDCCMYDSTYLALQQLYPRLSPGGFIIADNYGAIPRSMHAVTDYRSANDVKEPLNTIDWTGVWWRKQV